MTDAAPRRIALIGFGLIGGSIARALAAGTRRDAPVVAAWSPTGSGPARALEEGVVDAAPPEIDDALAGADLVVVAAPPVETMELLARLGRDLCGALSPGAVTTDVASTKSAVGAAAAAAGIRFVGGHPMAGREASGYAASTADLFRDRPWVVVPPSREDPAAIERVEWLVRACGARPVRATAADHDAAVAAISHLPLVASAALVEAVAGSDGADPPASWPLGRELAAGGWASMTRLALGDPGMGAGIAATNADELAAVVRRYRDVLGAWLALLETEGGPDAAALEQRFRTARTRLLADDAGEP